MRCRRRGMAAIATVVLLLILDLIIIRIVIGGARDHDLTVRRLETIQAFYAAEAGMNMAIREMMNDTDEDGDGAIGTISDDATPANNPAFGQAQVLVTSAVAGPHTTLTSHGRAGDVRREVEATSGGIIDTVAGTGVAGYSGDGGPATSAQINKPTGAAVDASGNIYIVDTLNNRIRKVDAATGIIQTVAGTGGAGYSGDGGPATSAEIKNPVGVAVDASGNIYIADTENHRIRKVDAATGIIQTVAGTGVGGDSGDGGPATSAQLRKAQGVTVDASGNIYIADTLNQRIRKVDAPTGIIQTVAGTGVAGYSGDGGPATSAQIKNPAVVAVDASGNIYIGDTDNHRIRKVDPATGIIQTVAGTGVAGYSGDGGPATSAQIKNPAVVAVDASGNIYIGDTDNHRIRKVDPATGIIQTVAGTGVAGYSGDGGLATSAQLKKAQGVTVDASGNIYIADTENYRIRKVDPSIRRVVRWQEVEPQ